MIEPNWNILDKLVEMSDKQIDASMGAKLKALKGKSSEKVKAGLHEILDACAYGALASTFVMLVLDGEWKRLGGDFDDPAPWRKK